MIPLPAGYEITVDDLKMSTTSKSIIEFVHLPNDAAYTENNLLYFTIVIDYSYPDGVEYLKISALNMVIFTDDPGLNPVDPDNAV